MKSGKRYRESKMCESAPLDSENCSPKNPAHGPLILKSVSLATMQRTSPTSKMEEESSSKISTYLKIYIVQQPR